MPSSRLSAVRAATLAAYALLTAALQPAGAIDFVWDNGGSGNIWTDAANWDPDGIPMPQDTATIDSFTATIPGIAVPPVDQLELNQAQLLMSGASFLHVLGTATLASGSDLAVTAGNGEFRATQIRTSANVLVDGAATVNALQQYLHLGSAAVTQLTGGGTLTSPDVRIRRGRLEGTGTIAGNTVVGGGFGFTNPEIAPGIGTGTGSLNFNGNLELNANAEVLIEIDASGHQPIADRIDVSGILTMGGTWRFDLIAGTSIPRDQAVEILVAGQVEPGVFSIDGLATAQGSVVVRFEPAGGSFTTVKVSTSETPGDMNGDNRVDELDAHVFAYAIRSLDDYEDRFFTASGSPPEFPNVPCWMDSMDGPEIVDDYCVALAAEIADMDMDSQWTVADIPAFLDAVAARNGNVAAAMAEIVRVFNQPAPEPSSALLAAVVAGIWNLRRRQR